MVDGCNAQTTEAVCRLAWSRRFILVVPGGGATGVCQPSDADLHQDMKRLYVELEMNGAMQHQRLRPGCCPVPRKQDWMAWWASTWGQRWLRQAAADGYERSASLMHWMGRKTISYAEWLVSLGRSSAWHRPERTPEVAAGLLEGPYWAAGQIIVPHPMGGRRLDVSPHDGQYLGALRLWHRC